MLQQYYQAELRCLRELGKEFAEANPEIAGMLSHGGADPDVDRLMQAFAFLTGRIRRRLDDDFPEIVRALMEMVSPHSVRQLPSIAMMEFQGRDSLRSVQTIPAGTRIDSKKVQGVRCRFSTTSEMELAPLQLEHVELNVPHGAAARLHLILRPRGKLTLAECLPKRLRLHVHGDYTFAAELYRLLASQVTSVCAQPPGKMKPKVSLGDELPQAVGFDADEAILPHAPSTVPGHWLMQEYFAFPEKFFFVDLGGLDALRDPAFEEGAEIILELSEVPDAFQRVTTDNLRLHCTPAVNLFESTSQPITVQKGRSRYRLRPENPRCHWVYSVGRVTGVERLTAREIVYPSYLKAAGTADDHGKSLAYHHLEAEPADNTDAPEYYLRFVRSGGSAHVPETEALSVDLAATNGVLPEALSAGDVSFGGPGFPEYAKAKNLEKPTDAVDPPLGSGLHRRLLAHLSLGSEPLTSVEALREVLSLHDTPGQRSLPIRKRNARRIDGVVGLQSAGVDHLHEGGVLRGVEVRVDMKSSHFACRGDMYLFASILDHFFGLHVAVNQFTRLLVRDVDGGEVWEWPLRSGNLTLL
jgi:type VI secretion system protein ImpG